MADSRRRWKQEIAAAGQADILFVAAAGNQAANNDALPFYPASFADANVVAVAATDENDALSSFSNYGATSVDLAAPGNNILSTITSNRYGQMSGTSMATPHVAGAAMLLLSTCSLNTAQLKAAILGSVDVLPSLNGIVASKGRLNAATAVNNCSPRLTPPTITLTSPASGATYVAPATIALGATATDADGIKRVEFYANGIYIGQATTSPYQGTWSGVAAGNLHADGTRLRRVGRHSVVGPGPGHGESACRSNQCGGCREWRDGDCVVDLRLGLWREPVRLTAIGRGVRGATAAAGTMRTPNSWPDWLEVDFAGAEDDRRGRRLQPAG